MAYRLHIMLTEPQRAFLEAEAKRLGLSVAEILRRILDEYREPRKRTAA